MSHDGEVNHTASEFPFIFAPFGPLSLQLWIPGPLQPAFTGKKPQARDMAKGPAESWSGPGRVGVRGVLLGHRERTGGALAISTIASISSFLLFFF